jgi:hypothetical protein
MNCSYCHRPLEVRKRSWFNPFTGSVQCDRRWCRVRSGHMLWWWGLELVSWTLTIRIRCPLYLRWPITGGKP